MKKIATFFVLLVIVLPTFAQAPQGFSYQAVIRNNANELQINKSIGMRITLLQGSVNGTVVYSETQNVMSNSNGLVTLEIGAGAGFSAINWANGPYFIRTETDPGGGTNYSITGVVQLLSVPYALYSKTSGSSLPGPKGDTGLQGLQGDKGEIGPAGKSAYQVWLESGNTGTINDFLLAQKGPKGDTGSVEAVFDDTQVLTNKTWTSVKINSALGEKATISSLAPVATSGSYEDLSKKPVIPSQYTDAMADSRIVAGITNKVDKVSGKGLSTEDYTTTEKTKLAAITGNNTGDQDLSGLATTSSLADGLSLKVDKVAGKGLSSNDYTTIEKTKLSGIAAGAEVNVQANWTQATTTADDYIKNKPTIPTQYTDAMADARVVAGITNKVDKVSGKGLSTNDYTTTEKTKLAAITGTNTGDQDISAMTHTNRAALDAVSGVNTGDQDLSGLATKTALKDSTAKLRAAIPSVSGFLSTETDPAFTASPVYHVVSGDLTNWNTAFSWGNHDGLYRPVTWVPSWSDVGGKPFRIDTSPLNGDLLIWDGGIARFINWTPNFLTSYTETDPVYAASQAAKIKAADITKLSNLSGVNTGDQDLSGLATTSSVTTSLNLKVDKETGKGLSANDYTTVEKTKLSGIAAGAEVNVQADWTQATTTADDYIKNKPTIPSQYTDAMADARVAAGITNKVDKVSGKGLSTEDYTTVEKTKLAGISENANNYVHPTGDGNLHVPATSTTNVGKVLTAGSTAGSLIWTTPFSGLTNFTESNYTYNTKTGVKWLAKNDATDVDFVISPKGKGAITVSQPDGTPIGGDSRGDGAVDLQIRRLNHAHVASGLYSVILGGSSNTASGEYSGVLSGNWNLASNSFSLVSGGVGNTAGGESSVVLGGGHNIANGSYSLIGGLFNTAPSFGETVLGHWSTIYTPGTDGAIKINPTDRLFAVGNGTSDASTSNALTILKNANTTIGGTLTVNGNGAGTSLTLPSGRGLSGQVLSTDGSGSTTWTTASGGTITSVSGTAPIVSSGGTAPSISISAATTSVAGSMSATDKTKLDGIATGAEVNVNADWNAASGDAQILNKPDMTVYATKNMNSANITNLADPVNAQDAATKAYVDALKAEVNILKLKVELLAGTTVSDLMAAGNTIEELIAAGVTSSQFIGINYAGGVIFSLDPANRRGLVCAVSDVSSGATWGNASTLCTGLVLNGYDDWFLPDFSQLLAMCSNKDIINKTASAHGGQAFADVYWTSYEFVHPYFSKGGFVLTASCTNNIEDKGYLFAVRAIRSFTF